MNYITINQKAWDKRANIHFASEWYDVQGFLNGQTSLKEIELAEVGSVAGKKLLHLQCHFGLDTLSWAREGAEATGVDLSPQAIRRANELKAKASLQAAFICSDVYDYEAIASPEFDIVVASYGVLNWLPDLNRWARVVAKSLRAGGHLHLIEFHPILEFQDGDAYFPHQEPAVGEGGTYTENCDGQQLEMATWSHPLSEVVNALVNNGIAIDHLNEFPFSPYNCFVDLEEKEEGRFYLKGTGHPLPMVYSVKGTKR